jgi:hypothetical protein
MPFVVPQATEFRFAFASTASRFQPPLCGVPET